MPKSLLKTVRVDAEPEGRPDGGSDLPCRSAAVPLDRNQIHFGVCFQQFVAYALPECNVCEGNPFIYLGQRRGRFL
jgi:hypothetical protein